MPRWRSFSSTRGRWSRTKPRSSIRDQVTRRRCPSPREDFTTETQRKSGSYLAPVTSWAWQKRSEPQRSRASGVPSSRRFARIGVEERRYLGVSPRFGAGRETEPRQRRQKNSWNPAAATRLGCGEAMLTAGSTPPTSAKTALVGDPGTPAANTNAALRAGLAANPRLRRGFLAYEPRLLLQQNVNRARVCLVFKAIPSPPAKSSPWLAVTLTCGRHHRFSVLLMLRIARSPFRGVESASTEVLIGCVS